MTRVGLTMATASGKHFRLTAAAAASFVMMGASVHASAQDTTSWTTVRNAVQAAVDQTDSQSAGMNEGDARLAYRSAMQGAITQSGARPSVVRTALGGVVCSGRDALRKRACDLELANLLQQVIQLADADIKNGDVAAVRQALIAAVSALSGPPTAGGGGTTGAGGSSGYKNP